MAMEHEVPDREFVFRGRALAGETVVLPHLMVPLVVVRVRPRLDTAPDQAPTAAFRPLHDHPHVLVDELRDQLVPRHGVLSPIKA
jgi:hypothetical protein